MEITAKINIDWISEDDVLDEAVERKLLDSLSRAIQNEFMKEAGKKIAESANNLITAKTELLINTVLEQPVMISTGWQNKEEYDSIYDMVEKKMTALYQGKLDVSGQCQKDPLLSNIEEYVKSSVNKLLTDVENIIRKRAAEAAKTEVKEHELIKALSHVVTIK